MLVVAQKIVSKAEGRFVDVATVKPSARAMALAAETDKDPRLVEVMLSESRRIVRHRPNLIIAEHRRGWVMANAGIDHSNVAPGDGHERVLLLPLDPDASARALREELVAAYGVPVAIIISDSFGRPLRRGTVGIALGAAGLPAVIDWRGHPDLFGRAARSHRNRLCRRDRRRRLAGHGPGRRGDADRPGARPALVGARGARRRAGPPAGARSLPMSASRAGAGAVGRRRRRQAGARALPHPAARHADRRRQYRRRFRASRALDLARPRHAALYAVGPGESRTGLGPARRDLDFHGRARSWAARPGSASATAISPPMSSAPGGSPRARACRRSSTISAAASASPRAAAADERRSGAHAARHQRGLARLPGLFRAAALRAEVRRLDFAGSETARPHPDFLAALADPRLRAVVICPSNPFISIDPILAVPGVREALRACRAPVVAVSPIIAGKAVKGPTAKMMEELGLPVDAAAVARHYRDFLDLYIADEADRDAVLGSICRSCWRRP